MSITPPPPTPVRTLNTLLNVPEQMELCQIELIYRAEGNANLVLALPQFKKVLRLPKMIFNRRRQSESNTKSKSKLESEMQTNPHPAGESSVSAEAGDLTMPDFMAYIEIMRRLLGNEFVCEADIVAIPKEDDRFWINEHIRHHRPVSRLDKEFVGPFGLLLPDVTQLPATFDVLLANLQATDEAIVRGEAIAGVRRLGHTYAIEIKPKQGWLQFASDVNDLFDLMPTEAKATTTEHQTTRKDEGESNETGQGQEMKPILDKGRCKCRYCSMQVLKLSKGKIKQLSGYCPMDLFSGAPGRMLDALNALFACPQNNLRVFQNGNLIYGDHANSISCEQLYSQVFPGEIMVLIKHLLVACLLREYSVEQREKEQEKKEYANQCQRESQTQTQSQSHVAIGQVKTKGLAGEIGAANVAMTELAKRQVEGDDGETVEVDSVNSGQSSRRTREAAGETATTQRYTKRCRLETATKTTETKTETRPTRSPKLKENQNQNQTQAQVNRAERLGLQKNCVLQKILHLQLLVKQHFDYMWQANYSTHSQRSYKALRELLPLIEAIKLEELQPEQAYMLGATALDCSIMLTFQEIECQDNKDNEKGSPVLCPALGLVTVLGHQFLTKLTVLDLDPKPDSHFHKFIEQTREIEKCCQALN
ncbi:inositol-pentakisphosphate 2-kinase isoform X1 [Drosophila willistoni]|uniref:inositol-pentakisphosphate 2-kinase isoform X1 n=1 Tax=Drosophila willistoni TaxID=7260 RepID=UPI00017D97AF|nr:inositol-pentakisphosphate 2-kinase isoform X1 [Drosophila willistoni]